MQSSCFLQLCLKVNLVEERSPQPRERSEIIHHCSRGERAAHKSSGPERPRPLRSAPVPRSAPLRASLLRSPRLRSSAALCSALLLASPQPSSPFPALAPLARCRTDSPSLVQLPHSSPARHHRVRARVLLSAGAEGETGSVPPLSARRENGVVSMNHNKIASRQFVSRSLSGTPRPAPPSPREVPGFLSCAQLTSF